MEWDFQDDGIDVVDFYRGLYAWDKFDGFVEKYRLNGVRSFLAWAEANDDERYEAAHKAGLLTKSKARIETFEWGQAEQLLAALVGEVRQLTHITNQKGAKHPKKFRDKPWPSPHTAIDTLKAKAKAVAAERRKAFMSMITFQPTEEWRAEIAEHEAKKAAPRPKP